MNQTVIDPLDIVDRMLAAMSDGADVESFLHDDVHFRSDVIDTLGKDDLITHMEARRINPKDRVMKRNLVFVWWTIDGIDGPEEQGTWIISVDQDGLVIEWQEFRG